MRNPAGEECKFFYGDYHRGRNQQECRLLKSSALEWRAEHCRNCPVPSIVRANACESMMLTPRISRSIIYLFKPTVEVFAYCQKSLKDVKEPHVGCGECHPINFVVKE